MNTHLILYTLLLICISFSASQPLKAYNTYIIFDGPDCSGKPLSMLSWYADGCAFCTGIVQSFYQGITCNQESYIGSGPEPGKSEVNSVNGRSTLRFTSLVPPRPPSGWTVYEDYNTFTECSFQRASVQWAISPDSCFTWYDADVYPVSTVRSTCQDSSITLTSYDDGCSASPTGSSQLAGQCFKCSSNLATCRAFCSGNSAPSSLTDSQMRNRMALYANSAYYIQSTGSAVRDGVSVVDNTEVLAQEDNIYSRARGARWFVARDSVLQKVVISFRGTETLEDWFSNVLFFSTRDSAGRTVHTGFNERANVFLDQLMAALPGIRYALENSQTIVVGHSLGAAVAAVMTAKFPTVVGYGFATPRVYADRLPMNFVSYINGDDFIPRLSFAAVIEDSKKCAHGEISQMISILAILGSFTSVCTNSTDTTSSQFYIPGRVMYRKIGETSFSETTDDLSQLMHTATAESDHKMVNYLAKFGLGYQPLNTPADLETCPFVRGCPQAEFTVLPHTKRSTAGLDKVRTSTLYFCAQLGPLVQCIHRFNFTSMNFTSITAFDLYGDVIVYSQLGYLYTTNLQTNATRLALYAPGQIEHVVISPTSQVTVLTNRTIRVESSDNILFNASMDFVCSVWSRVEILVWYNNGQLFLRRFNGTINVFSIDVNQVVDMACSRRYVHLLLSNATVVRYGVEADSTVVFVSESPISASISRISVDPSGALIAGTDANGVVSHMLLPSVTEVEPLSQVNSPNSGSTNPDGTAPKPSVSSAQILNVSVGAFILSLLFC